MGLSLDEQEISDLTGYRRNADRCRWLSSHGWKFEVSAKGFPVVSRSHYEAMMNPCVTAKKAWSPNVASLRKAA